MCIRDRVSTQSTWGHLFEVNILMEKASSLKRSYENLAYLEGFGNHFATEAKKGALPVGQNSPQKCPYDLYAEQVSGTAFTVPRVSNQRTWLYRIQPAVKHLPFSKSAEATYRYVKNDYMKKDGLNITPNQTRWHAFPFPPKEQPTNFVEGLVSVCGAGDPTIRTGISIYIYACNTSMNNTAFCSADGDFLIVPQTGTLYIVTEMGKMTVAPKEIAVIQRGIRFSVEITEDSRGWVAEVFKGHLRLPDLGPIGANGLANPRDFETPAAYFEEDSTEWKVIHKYQGEMFECTQDHSPFDVVAWHGNYAPYRYSLDRFCPMNAVRYDHPDPSIFTVLTCPSDEPGVAVLDFVIFPPRWMVAENTFRPPYYHRNCMSEYMGNIAGSYDGKGKGFEPGKSSLHSYMTPHGPSAVVFEKASTVELQPERYSNDDLSFMFETSFMLRGTTWALDDQHVDKDYYHCWSKLRPLFKNE
eukprot:TRINITY_DN1108_c0_g1_i6.p1 TRINITY_DN1108_c0_g1~~TRINITY_DN1108_c0_g1_i6.p1  ORF type:complete len:470 (-),score=100.35 TRINITY_DN1108_c0_g1_i6:167-1576(-)